MKLIPITDPKDIPSGMSNAEEAKFWETHWVTDEYVDKLKEQRPTLPHTSPKQRNELE